MTPARVFIVDDHQIVRDGVRLLLGECPEFAVVGGAFDAESGWQAIQQAKPDLVVLDLELPGDDGTSLLQRLGTSFPEMKLVVLTGHEEPQFVDSAIRAGAHGYVLKSGPSNQLVDALRAVLAGQVYLSPEIATLVVREYRKRPPQENPIAQLTARELEVLRQIAAGQTTKEIAFSLGVSAKTVETHRLKLLSKLGVRSVAELTKLAVREGLTTL